MSAIGFIGLGTIGAPMAMRLVEAGHQLIAFDIDAEALERLVQAGAERAGSAQDIARRCTTVFLSLPQPAIVQAVANELIGATERALTTIVDLSTNSLALARTLAQQAAVCGIDYLDAPVSGGKVAARAGQLAVMVGGESAAYARVEPLIACFGAHRFHLGAVGAGTLAKLVNNQIFLCASVLIQEGFVLAAKAGMDTRTLHDVLKVSSAGSLLARAPLVLSGQYERDIFALAIAEKDVALALETATDLDAPHALTAAAHEVYRAALEQGFGEQDFYATLKVLEAAAGTDVSPLEAK